MRLPKDIDPTDFDERYRLEPVAWAEAIRETCEAHGLSGTGLTPFADGSNLIAAVSGGYVVKIFPPFHRHQWESERRVLRRLWDHGRRLPIPRLIAEGEREDGWPYVVLSHLPGVTLERVWPELSRRAKAAVMAEIGRMMAQVHAVPVESLTTLRPDWGEFIAGQTAGFSARHRRLGMPEWFLRDAEAFVAGNLALLPAGKPVILTGEYTPFNLLAEGGRLTGMIDFGDAMIGPREYDFLGPCLFLGEGDPLLLHSLFEGYGYAPDETLRKRLLLLAVLHRYSNLKFQIRISGWEKTACLSDLGALVFPF